MAYGGPFYFFLHAAAWAASALIPDREVPVCVIGAQSVGKSTLDASLRNDFRPVYQDRVPTIQPGPLVRDAVHLPEAPNVFRDYRNTQWLHRDYHHLAEAVRPQFFEFKPEVVIWLLSANPDEPNGHGWTHPYNHAVLGALVDVLKSPEYLAYAGGGIKIGISRRGRPVLKNKKKRRRCRYVVMMVNKLDVLNHLTPQERAGKLKEIIDHYLQSDTMAYLRALHDPQLIYIATSLQDANYLPFNQLHGQPKPLSEFFTDLVTLIVRRNK